MAMVTATRMGMATATVTAAMTMAMMGPGKDGVNGDDGGNVDSGGSSGGGGGGSGDGRDWGGNGCDSALGCLPWVNACWFSVFHAFLEWQMPLSSARGTTCVFSFCFVRQEGRQVSSYTKGFLFPTTEPCTVAK